MLENEKQKMEDLENAHQQAMDSWTETIGPRQQVVHCQMKLSTSLICVYMHGLAAYTCV